MGEALAFMGDYDRVEALYLVFVKVVMIRSFVIPAKAGIHDCMFHWISAFPGMAGGV